MPIKTNVLASIEDPCATIRDRRYWIMPCAAMARRIRDIKAAYQGKKNVDSIIARWAEDVALRLAFQDDPVDDFEVELHLATKCGRRGGAPYGNRNACKVARNEP